MKKRSLFLLIIIVAICIPVISKFTGDSDHKTVEVSPVRQHAVRPSILASGTLTHREEVNLSSEVIGKVAEVLVEEGDKVTADQLVLRVDDQNFVAAFELANAQVKLSTIDIERQMSRIDNLDSQWHRKKLLHQKKMVGDDEFENITHQLALAKIDLKSSRERLRQANAQLEQADDQLRKTQIRSPISGIVTSLDIEVGETAIASSTNIPGSSLMTVADPASIFTEVLVDEADIATIALGQYAEIVAIAYPDSPMNGTISFVANTAKVEQGRQGLSFTVHIEIDDQNDVILRPGMTCRAEIFSRSDDKKPSLPLQAIIFEEDRSEQKTEYYVFVNDNGVAKKILVEVGVSDDEFQEILSGIKDNAEVIVGPPKVLRHLLDGDEINPIAMEIESEAIN